LLNSDYPKSSKFFSDENEKVIGKFQDEAAAKPIVEFLGLKSKMYSYRKEEYEKYLENKTAKGLKKNVIRREINHSDYRDTPFNNIKMHHQTRNIRSEHHQISSYQLNKVSLSPFDDKRYIHSDGITSYAYGHKKFDGLL